MNGYFVTSKEIPAYREPNFPLTSSIYLVFLPLLGIQRRHKLTTRFFTLSEKTQSFKNGNIKNHFLLCVCYWYKLLFDERFLLYVIIGIHCFS